jgi:hypothetical protein
MSSASIPLRPFGRGRIAFSTASPCPVGSVVDDAGRRPPEPTPTKRAGTLRTLLGVSECAKDKAKGCEKVKRAKK